MFKRGSRQTVPYKRDYPSWLPIATFVTIYLIGYTIMEMNRIKRDTFMKSIRKQKN